MKVVIIHRYFWPEEISTLPIMLKEVVALHTSRGDEVTVITGVSEKNEAKWDEELKAVISLKYFRSEIDRKLSNFGRLKNMFRLLLLSLRELSKNDFDLLYTVSYPPGLSAALVAFGGVRKKGTKVIFYVQDILTYRLNSKVMRAIYKKMFAYTCVHAHRIITLTGDMKQEILRICDTPDGDALGNKVVIIPNYSPDLYSSPGGDVAPGKESVIRNDNKPINIVYAGNHGEAQNLEHFIRVLSSDDSFKALSVVFFGEGTSKPALIGLANELDVSIDFRDPVSREEINRIMATCQLGLVGARPGLMNYAFPSKLASYNAADVPGVVMCNQESSLATWLNENQIGFCIDPVDVGKARDELKRALAQSKALDEGHVRSVAENIYSLDTYSKQFNTQLFSTMR